MSLDVLKSRIKENKLSGVFLFCGPEEYTKDHYVGLIRKKVDSSPLPEFNHTYFNASSDKICDLEDAIYSLPYMWDTKLIEITDLESAKITESDVVEYSRIFSDIPDYLTIIAVLRADEQTEENRNTKNSKSGISAFINAVKENGLVVEFENERADKLTTWITKHLNSHGVVFDQSVPRELINVCGSDMYILQGEILKLKEVYSGAPLKSSDVRKYCCANNAFKFFDIANALNRRDIVTAKRIMENIDLTGDNLPKAIGFLAKNYSEMLLVKMAIDSGKSFEFIEKDLKIQKWKVGKIATAVSSVDIKTLSFAIAQLSLADNKIKSYRGNPKRILELTFYRICTYGRKA
jgi:DNA polymerase-3 subunit delta